ncbi:MAG: aminomethyl-transferring glycine dehydrogenase subunit GcvPA [bacterium JZ-2024 1]
MNFPYLPHTEEDIQEMLRVIGISDLEDLFSDIPVDCRLHRDLNLPPPKSEMEVRDFWEKTFSHLPAPNIPSFLGAGSYRRWVPAVVDYLANRGEFLTSYTPYQPEMSQGMLQALYEYQSAICRLTGMEISHSSSYDGATATADALRMASLIRPERKTVLLSEGVHPHIQQVLRTYFQFLPLKFITLPLQGGITSRESVGRFLSSDLLAIILQNPNFLGYVEEEAKEVIAEAKGAGGFSILVCEPISLALLPAPGELGADIAVGDGQPLGNYPSFGGPSFGFLTSKKDFLWQMPGRIIGKTVDSYGKDAYVMTVQAREQHIKREKATSNLCTNQALMAVRALIYLSLLGTEGLKKVLDLSMRSAHYLYEQLLRIPGIRPLQDRTFLFEFPVKLPMSPSELNAFLFEHYHIVGGLDLTPYHSDWKNGWLLACTELTGKAEIELLVQAVREKLL